MSVNRLGKLEVLFTSTYIMQQIAYISLYRIYRVTTNFYSYFPALKVALNNNDNDK